MNMLTANETVPVFIWAEDIDQSVVQSDTENAVGFSKESIAQPLSMASDTYAAWARDEEIWVADNVVAVTA